MDPGAANNNGRPVEKSIITTIPRPNGTTFHFSGACRPNVFLFQTPGHYAINMYSGVDNSGSGNYGFQLAQQNRMPTPLRPMAPTAIVNPWNNVGGRVLGSSSVPVNSKDKSPTANSG